METKPKPKKIRAVCRGCGIIKEVVAGKHLCLDCYLKPRKR